MKTTIKRIFYRENLNEVFKKLNHNFIYDDEVELSKSWIAEFTKPSKSYNEHNSYLYKHIVERHFKKYISNDSFIKAAIDMNIHCYGVHKSQNYYFKFAIKDKKILYK